MIKSKGGSVVVGVEMDDREIRDDALGVFRGLADNVRIVEGEAILPVDDGEEDLAGVADPEGVWIGDGEG